VDVVAGELELKTTSGAIQGHSIRSEAMSIEADSGGIALAGVDTRRFSINTGSGDVDLGALLNRTREASIRSLSGDVTLRVGPLAPFDLAARTESGTVKAESTSFAVEQKEKAEATVRRGTGGADLEVTTTSGSVVLKTR
jgi:DUF4097 and DUF4098 domain-containing protein YvlB